MKIYAKVHLNKQRRPQSHTSGR